MDINDVFNPEGMDEEDWPDWAHDYSDDYKHQSDGPLMELILLARKFDCGISGLEFGFRSYEDIESEIRQKIAESGLKTSIEMVNLGQGPELRIQLEDQLAMKVIDWDNAMTFLKYMHEQPNAFFFITIDIFIVDIKEFIGYVDEDLCDGDLDEATFVFRALLEMYNDDEKRALKLVCGRLGFNMSDDFDIIEATANQDTLYFSIRAHQLLQFLEGKDIVISLITQGHCGQFY